jgi:hypothetical protein
VRCSVSVLVDYVVNALSYWASLISKVSSASKSFVVAQYSVSTCPPHGCETTSNSALPGREKHGFTISVTASVKMGFCSAHHFPVSRLLSLTLTFFGSFLQHRTTNKMITRSKIIPPMIRNIHHANLFAPPPLTASTYTLHSTPSHTVPPRHTQVPSFVPPQFVRFLPPEHNWHSVHWPSVP